MNDFVHKIIVDWSYLWKVLLLTIIGLLCIYSSTVDHDHLFYNSKFIKQVIWFFLGFCVIFTTVMIPPRIWYRMATPLYLFTLGLLVLVLLVGKTGAHRWIHLGFIQFQPSEFAKITTLLVGAKILSKDEDQHLYYHKIIKLIVIIGIPCILILKEPDIGSASVFIVLFWGMVIWLGVNLKILFCLFIPFLTLISGFHPIGFIAFMVIIILGLIVFRIKWFFGLGFMLINGGLGLLAPVLWLKLEDYQQQRILLFLGLISDPHGNGYQIIQSKVAIGSGGFWGKGFLQGSQTQLRFLPEQHTDFIFSVLGEEFGFIGCFFVLALLLWIIRRGLSTAEKARTRFESSVAIGCVTVIAYQCIVNIGMTLGFFPITGLPLPFLSYGGTSLWMVLVLIGFLSNISARRYDY